MTGTMGHNDDTITVEELYRSIGTDLHRFFLRRVSSSEVADELVQETFVRLLRRLETATVLKDPTAYLFRIARNLIVDHYRQSASTEVLEEILDEEFYTTDVDADVNGQRNTIASWLEDFIEALPLAFSETLRLAEIERLPYARIAAGLGISVGTVKSRVSRGRRLLRDALTECCLFAIDARGRVVDYEAKQCPRETCEQC